MQLINYQQIIVTVNISGNPQGRLLFPHRLSSLGEDAAAADDHYNIARNVVHLLAGDQLA